jgi:hypothetical protein
MAIAPLAPWLTGLQIVALLVTGDLECTAESLRREGDGADSRRLLTADEARSRARHMLATMLADPDADKTREGLEKYTTSVLSDRPPAYEVAGDRSRKAGEQRLADFKGDIWSWGGPSLRNLELQCGDAPLVSEAVQILNDLTPTLSSCDQDGRAIDDRVLATHRLEERPEGFLLLVRPGRLGQAPVGSGIMPRYSTSDLLQAVRQSLRDNPRFSDVVSLADQLVEAGTAQVAGVPSFAARRDQASDGAKHRVTAIVARAAADGKQIRRIDFFSWFARAPFGLGQKELQGLWAKIPPDWRSQKGGRLPESKRVSDWRAYDVDEDRPPYAPP